MSRMARPRLGRMARQSWRNVPPTAGLEHATIQVNDPRCGPHQRAWLDQVVEYSCVFWLLKIMLRFE